MGESFQVDLYERPAAPDRIIVERMRGDHLPGVLRIEQESYSTPWSREGFTKELENFPTTVAIVARRERAVVGYVVAWFVMEEVHIGNVAVAREARQQGIGRVMLEWLLERAVAHGCTFATLEVRESNLAARRLYERFSFRQVGRRRAYYMKPSEDAIVMVRELT